MKRVAATLAALTVLAVCAWLSSVAQPLQAAPKVSDPIPISRIAVLGVLAGSRDARQTLYTVPAGKRLMIESQTAVTIANGGVLPQVSVTAFNSSGGGLFYAVVPQIHRGWWDGQGEIYEGSSGIHMFADDGQAVNGQVLLNTVAPPVGGARVEVGFSGYLVDAP